MLKRRYKLEESSCKNHPLPTWMHRIVVRPVHDEGGAVTIRVARNLTHERQRLFLLCGWFKPEIKANVRRSEAWLRKMTTQKVMIVVAVAVLMIVVR